MKTCSAVHAPLSYEHPGVLHGASHLLLWWWVLLLWWRVLLLLWRVLLLLWWVLLLTR